MCVTGMDRLVSTARHVAVAPPTGDRYWHRGMIRGSHSRSSLEVNTISTKRHQTGNVDDLSPSRQDGHLVILILLLQLILTRTQILLVNLKVVKVLVVLGACVPGGTQTRFNVMSLMNRV